MLLLPQRRHSARSDQPPVSVLIPVGRAAPALDAALAAVLAQEYPSFEVLVCVAAKNAAAVSVGAGCRVIVSRSTGAASPKLDVLTGGLAAAAHDLVCVLDANMQLAAGQLAAVVRCLAQGVGLVTTGPIGTAPVGAAWIETAFLNFYQARYILAARAFGFDYGIGSVMLFSRDALGRAGGVAAISHTVAEDHAIQVAFAKCGLRTRIYPGMARQIIGVRGFGQVWQRQLRWMVIRRVEAFFAFLIEPFFATVFTVLTGVCGASALGVPLWLAGGATLVGWFGIEGASIAWLRRARPDWDLPRFRLAAALLRELVIPALWLRALSTRRVLWDGAIIPVRRK